MAEIHSPCHPLVAPEMREQTLAVMNNVLEALKAAFPDYAAGQAVVLRVDFAPGGPLVNAGVVEFAPDNYHLFQFVADERKGDTFIFCSSSGQRADVTLDDASGIVQLVRSVYESAAP